MAARELFPIRLRELREKAGYSQTELAVAISADNVQISRYESGVIAPSVDTLVKLADVFQCSTDYLLGRSDLPRMSGPTMADLGSDEWRVIRAIREKDIHNTFIALSLAFPRQMAWRDADELEVKRRRERREERIQRNRERYEAQRAAQIEADAVESGQKEEEPK